jgi:hypothetical protein
MNDKQIKGSQYQNGEIIQGSINVMSPTYIDASLASSVDPFNSKTSKYAESTAVKIQAVAKGVWARFSTDGTAAVAAADNCHYIEEGTEQIFHIENDYKYIRLIEAASAATSIVTELY